MQMCTHSSVVAVVIGIFITIVCYFCSDGSAAVWGSGDAAVGNERPASNGEE